MTTPLILIKTIQKNMVTLGHMINITSKTKVSQV